jgi:hypothetical protein
MPKTRIPSSFTLWLELLPESRALTGQFKTQSQLIRFLRNNLDGDSPLPLTAYRGHTSLENYFFIGTRLEHLILAIQSGVFYLDPPSDSPDHAFINIKLHGSVDDATELAYAMLKKQMEHL